MSVKSSHNQTHLHPQHSMLHFYSGRTSYDSVLVILPNHVVDLIFITYSKKELGNLSITNSYNIDMSTIDVSSNIDFNDKSNKAYVYKASVGDKEEAAKIASEIFSKVNTKIDESQNDEYDDTIVFK